MSELALLGGEKVRDKEFAPQQDFGEEEKCLVMEVLDSKVLSGFLASPGEKFMGGEICVGCKFCNGRITCCCCRNKCESRR